MFIKTAGFCWNVAEIDDEKLDTAWEHLALDSAHAAYEIRNRIDRPAPFHCGLYIGPVKEGGKNMGLKKIVVNGGESVEARHHAPSA